jgi:hypothetical protein
MSGQELDDVNGTVRTHGALVPAPTSVTITRVRSRLRRSQGAILHHAASGRHVCPSAFAHGARAVTGEAQQMAVRRPPKLDAFGPKRVGKGDHFAEQKSEAKCTSSKQHEEGFVNGPG